MPLPIRPPSEPGSGSPSQKKVEEDSLPSIGDSEALPQIDFGYSAPEQESVSESLPSLEDMVLPAFPDELPQPISEELPATVETSVSDDDFDDLFEDFESEYMAKSTPKSSAPESEEPNASAQDDFSELDFDSLFSEEAPDSSSPQGKELPVEDDDWDDYGFSEEVAAPVNSGSPESSLPENPFDDEEDWDKAFEEPEEEEAAPPLEADDELGDDEDSWDKEFEEFVRGVEDNPDETASESEDEQQQEEEEPSAGALAPLKKKGKAKRKGKGKARGAKGQNPILRNLAAIPVIGIIFKPLLKLGSIGVAILGLIPLLLIPLVMFLVALGSVPAGGSITGPDGGAATIGDFNYKDGQASAVVTNDGEIIASVTPELTLWSYNPLGGGSIFAFDQVGTCSPEEVSVDIDSNATVTAPCEANGGGLMIKVSGSISY